MFMWHHHPDGKDPQWEMPDIFKSFPQFDSDPDAYYRPFPEFSRLAEKHLCTRKSSRRTVPIAID